MIQILMSTYNGENYLEEQLESLLNQSYNDVKILIRDDGSKDSTLEILERYKTKKIEIKVVYGKNIGVVKSFFELIKMSDTKCNYFAFCDQDDFWEREKIERAILKLKQKKSALSYCSNLRLVNKNLKYIKNQYKKPLVPSIENAVVENIITGCTCIIKQELLLKIKEKINQIKIEKIMMHDWFIYIFSEIYGETIYDEKSYIKYRQHENNVIGMETNCYKSFFKRISNFKKNKGKRKQQLEEIFKVCKIEMTNEQKKLFISLKKNYFFTKIKRQNKINTIVTKFAIRIGCY